MCDACDDILKDFMRDRTRPSTYKMLKCRGPYDEHFELADTFVAKNIAGTLSPNSVVYTPKRDDEHSRPFDTRVPYPRRGTPIWLTE